MAATTNSRTAGIVLAVGVGGPALLAWLVWAFIVGTLAYSAVVATMGGNG